MFGLPDERLGEIVGSAVWVDDPSVKAADLCKHAADVGLSKFKIPDTANIFFHSAALPKGATGKLDKKGLRDQYSKLVTARDAMPRSKL